MKRKLNPPLQQRSQDTLDAISRATRKLLKSRSFRDLTIADIVKEAGSSAGSFYARFKGKQDLLHYLHEEQAASSIQQLEAYISTSGDKLVTPVELAEGLVPDMVRSHIENRGIIRATLVESLDDPGFGRRAMKLVRTIATMIASQTTLTAKTKEEHAINIQRAMGSVIAILDQNLFYDKTSLRSVPEEEVARLVRIFQASLDVSGKK